MIRQLRHSVLLLLIPIYVVSGIVGPASARSILPISRTSEDKISKPPKGTRLPLLLIYGTRRYVMPARVLPALDNAPMHAGEDLAIPGSREYVYVVRDEPCPFLLLLFVPHPRDPPASL